MSTQNINKTWIQHAAHYLLILDITWQQYRMRAEHATWAQQMSRRSCWVHSLCQNLLHRLTRSRQIWSNLLCISTEPAPLRPQSVIYCSSFPCTRLILRAFFQSNFGGSFGGRTRFPKLRNVLLKRLKMNVDLTFFLGGRRKGWSCTEKEYLLDLLL